MTQENTTEPIHLETVHNTPFPPLPIPHSSSAILKKKTPQTLPQQKGDVCAILKSNSLLHSKKIKGFFMVHSASCMAGWLSGALMWPWDIEREQGWESLANPHPQHCGAQRPYEASNPPQLLLLLHTKLTLRCAHSSLETNSQHNTKKEAMLLSEVWDKKDRAYLCGCMAAWHTVMSTLIKHGGHSQPSVGEGSALQARRSGPGDVSQILTGRFPHEQDARPRLIGRNVSWVIIFVQCRQGQHCESQRQGKKNKHRARS